MGIQKFTSVFQPKREIKYSELKDKKVVIDARSELYRGALGMKKLSENLIDNEGKPTTHINSLLLGVMLKLRAAGVDQYWVFDYDQKRKTGESFHVQLKELEIIKRHENRQKARRKVAELTEKKKNLEERARSQSADRKYKSSSEGELFSSDDEEVKQLNNELEACNLEIDKQKKRAFCLERFYTDDIIFMLNMLDIPWLMVPPGFEAEQVCAMATRDEKIIGVLMDYVLTPDADALPFGAKHVIKRNVREKKLYEYNLDELLEKNNINLDDLIKISLALGWEKIPKTPRIGPKTVLSKFRDIVLTDKQQEAYDFFHKPLTDEELKSIDVHNADELAFSNIEKYNQLLDWLEFKKGFSRSRIDAQFKKHGFFRNPDYISPQRRTRRALAD